jgi:outer membrane protein TolC
MTKLNHRLILSISCLIAATLIIICFTQPAYTQQPDNSKTLPLSLKDCIRLTVRNNLLLQQQRLDPQIKGRRITMEKALFDPDLILEAERDFSQNITPTALAGADEAVSKGLNMNVGLEKKLITGGALNLDFTNTRQETNSFFQTINPFYESVLSLSLVQPLLKDFGISVNEAQINIAVNNHRISIMELKQEMIATLSQSQKLYWDLVFNIENLTVRKLLLKQAQDLLERNKAKAEVGIMAQVEVLEAEAGVAARREGVIIAQDNIKDVENALKRITNLIAYPAGWTLTLIPTDKPAVQARQPDEAQSIAQALENRPEYAQAQMELKNSCINLALAKNRTLPELDLNGSIGLSGLGEDYNQNWDELFTTEHEIWAVGITLSVPLGNRFARNEHIQRKLEQEQAALKIKDIEQKIILEVREVLRQLKTNLKRIDTTRIAQELEQEKLKIEEQKFELGMTTSQDLLEDQAQLALAKIRHLQAIIDYNKSLIDLETVKGTTLKEHQIELKELYPST